MDHWLYQQMENRPEHAAIIYNDVTLTFKALYDKAAAVSGRIEALGLPTRIALQPMNQLSAVMIIHGMILAGREIVMINARLTADEVKRQMDSIETTVLVTDRCYDDIQCISLETLLTEHSEHYCAEVKSSNILSIMFTSGTTGVQKAVPQSYGNHIASAERCRKSFPYDADAAWLLTLPIYHISGLSVLLRSVMTGFTVILFEKFDADAIVRTIKRAQVTHLSLVPQTLEWLLEAGLETASLKGLLIGGAKLDERLLKRCMTLQLPIYTSFGMTETCSQFITASPDDIKSAPNAVGRVTDDIKVDAPLNGAGEILVRGDNVMNGYLYPEEANSSAFSDGYFLTGDIGQITNGYLYVLDRRKDLIISGGENIYPSELEQLFLTIPDMKACCVIGMKDERWGQRPVLVYEAAYDLDKAIEDVMTHIAKFKRPVRIIRTSAIARTSNGKISRHRVKEWLEHERQSSELL